MLGNSQPPSANIPQAFPLFGRSGSAKPFRVTEPISTNGRNEFLVPLHHERQLYLPPKPHPITRGWTNFNPVEFEGLKTQHLRRSKSLLRHLRQTSVSTQHSSFRIRLSACNAQAGLRRQLGGLGLWEVNGQPARSKRPRCSSSIATIKLQKHRRLDFHILESRR